MRITAYRNWYASSEAWTFSVAPAPSATLTPSATPTPSAIPTPSVGSRTPPSAAARPIGTTTHAAPTRAVDRDG